MTRFFQGWQGGAVIAAVAVLTGLAGSALAVRVSGYPGPPEQAAAVAAASHAVGREPVARTGPTVRCPMWCPDPSPSDGVVSYESPPDRTDVTTVAFDGEPVPAVGHYRGLALHSSDSLVIVSKSLSPPALILALAGLLLGGAAGGLATHRLLRRHRRHDRGRRAITEVLISLTVAVAAGYAALTVMLLANTAAEGRWRPADVQAAEFILTVFRPATLIAVVAAALALVSVLVRARPPHPAPAP